MPTPTPVSKADMDPVFEKRFRELQQHAQTEYTQRRTGGQVKWDRPIDWNGNPFDFEGMHLPPFSREKANADYLKAVQNPDAPGTTGDVVATLTMIDVLAIMERAFRVRYTMRRPRGVAQLLGRKRGQGDAKGAFIESYVEYLRAVLEQSKAKDG